MSDSKSPSILLFNSIIFYHATKDITNKMYSLYKVSVMVLLTQELTPFHVISCLESDQRPWLGLCTHCGLLH